MATKSGSAVSANEALKILKDGNERFVNDLKQNRIFSQEVKATATGQSPFAAVLSCMDSRVSVELIFDQGVGNIFSVRLAGNVVSPNTMGSLEYAVAGVGVKLVVVMGHTNCGAIKGACDYVANPKAFAGIHNLELLLDKIVPAVKEEKLVKENRTSSNEDYVNKVAEINTFYAIEQIMEKSEVIRHAVESGDIKLVPAMYDVATGKVSFDLAARHPDAAKHHHIDKL